MPGYEPVVCNHYTPGTSVRGFIEGVGCGRQTLSYDYLLLRKTTKNEYSGLIEHQKRIVPVQKEKNPNTF